MQAEVLWQALRLRTRS